MTWQIRKDQLIGGLPAVDARMLAQILRRRGGGFSQETIEYFMGYSPEKASEVMNFFISEEIIQNYRFFKDMTPDPKFHELTPLGMSLASASLVGGYKRKSCKKALDCMLARVEELNKDPWYRVYIKQVIIYGSMLGTKEILGDVDVAIEVAWRYKDISNVEHRHFFESFTRIKARSPILQIIPLDEDWMKDKPHRVIKVSPPVMPSLSIKKVKVHSGYQVSLVLSNGEQIFCPLGGDYPIETLRNYKLYDSGTRVFWNGIRDECISLQDELEFMAEMATDLATEHQEDSG